MLDTGHYMLQELRRHCAGEVFDYGFLMSHLKQYKAPHRKITTLLKSGAIVRIKKGLYIFGEQYRLGPVHQGLIANLIFGPSYVSGEYALSYYSLISERVYVVTSVTTKRKKIFETPIGVFQYSYINPKRFAVGVQWQALNNEHFLIASPEKALIDTIAKYNDITSMSEMREHLLENMRLDQEQLQQMDLLLLDKIKNSYQSPIVNLCYKTLVKGV